VLGFVVLLLSDFLGVCDVSWISHQLIDGFRVFAGRIRCSHGPVGRLSLS
jgi:hypothetical protein